MPDEFIEALIIPAAILAIVIYWAVWEYNAKKTLDKLAEHADPDSNNIVHTAVIALKKAIDS